MSRYSLVLLLLICACHHEKKPVMVTPQPTATATQQAAPVKQEAQPVSQNLSADDDLLKKCSIVAVKQDIPRFDFDNSELTSQDRDVLQQVATCLTTGPLKGKKLELIGRADPRGTEEYNLGLGDRRAHQVGEYLERLGVSKIDSKTRGALDATGRDDSGWAQDRRVDLKVD